MDKIESKPSTQSPKTKTLVAAVKNCAKAVFWSCPILPNFFMLFQIFCPRLKISLNSSLILWNWERAEESNAVVLLTAVREVSKIIAETSTKEYFCCNTSRKGGTLLKRNSTIGKSSSCNLLILSEQLFLKTLLNTAPSKWSY